MAKLATMDRQRISTAKRSVAFGRAKNKPNAETIAAIQEARDIISGKQISKTYASAAELFAELDAEC